MSSKHSLHSGDLALRLEAIRTSQEPESEPNVASHPPTLPIISSFSGLEDYPAREPDIDTTRDISLFDADTTPTRSIYRPSPAASGFIFPVVDADQSKMAKILQTFGLRPKPTRAPPLAPYSPQFENNLFSRSTNGPNCAVFPEVANQEAGFDAVFSRSSSRRSESSDGSCVSSNFREYSSSSGSGSDSDSNGGDQRERNLLLNPTTLVPTSVLNIGKTHRLIRRYVTELGNPHSVAQLIAATGLLQTSKKDDRGRQEVLWCLTKGKKNRQLTLKHLFRLADDEAYSSPHYCQLRHTATSAQLIDTVISGCVDTTKLVTSMCIYLQDWTVLDGAAGVQYTLEKWRHLFQAIPSVEVILHRYAERVLVHTLHVATPPALAMCLLKLMLQEDTIHARELSRAALDRIISTLGPPVSYSTSASLHLIRSMDTVPHHILSHNVIDSLMYIITNNSDQLLKRLAFSTLAKLLPYRATIENRVMDLAIHVLLWNTNWQHYHSAQKQAKLWDDSVIIPHDDAYRIITSIKERAATSIGRGTLKNARPTLAANA
ncbi:hypothetical protein FRB93_008575 [Tulasnella sp. JGI-2019a]|nr:hypothetical protein FRB93_008575 [Tulasnella sp. JGI-2019a]